MKLLGPVFIDLKKPESTHDLTDHRKMITATIVTCCLAKLDILPKAEYSMVLMQQFVLEPDVSREKCDHYELIGSLLTSMQSR